DLEGNISAEPYGSATGMVSGCGNYRAYWALPVDSVKEGKLNLILEGEKAKSEWTLVRIRGRDDEKNKGVDMNREDYTQTTTKQTLGKSASKRAYESEAGRRTTSDRRLDLRTQIRRDPSDRSQKGRKSFTAIAK